jgi:hypothetical protein
MKPEDRDREVSIRLGRLEAASHWLKYDAEQIQQTLRGLEQRRPFETRAREALNECETELRVALALVKTAQEIYDNLRIDPTTYTISQETEHAEH